MFGSILQHVRSTSKILPKVNVNYTLVIKNIGEQKFKVCICSLLTNLDCKSFINPLVPELIFFSKFWSKLDKLVIWEAKP